MEKIVKFNFQDFPSICRICLIKTNTLMPLGHVLDVFQTITSIKIETKTDDVLPRNGCTQCVEKLEDISYFISLCKSSDVTLKRIRDISKAEMCLEDVDVNYHKLEDCNSDIADDPEDDDIALESERDKHGEIKTKALIDLSSDLGSKAFEQNKSKRHSTKRQPSICDICGQNFDTKSKLNDHQKKNIQCRNSEYKCMNCEKGFSTKVKLNLHMRSHTKETPYECQICLKKFRFPQNLKRHDDIVHKCLKPFKCDVCGKDFARLERKIQHMNIHTDTCPHTCGYCGKSFKHRSTYQSHITDHKIKNGELQDLSDIECYICKKVFCSKSMLQSHIEIHNGEKQFLCSICGKEFLKKCYLDVHSRIHTGENPFQCNHCGKKFKHASSYKSHTLFHTGERSFKCDICSKMFKQSAHLSSHFRTHTGERPFKCNFCGKAFAHNSNLKTHTRIHTGETPHHCPICDKGFYDLSAMKKHKKGH